MLKNYVLIVLLSCKTLCVCFMHSAFYVRAFNLFHPLLKQLQKFQNSSAFKRKLSFELRHIPVFNSISPDCIH